MTLPKGFGSGSAGGSSSADVERMITASYWAAILATAAGTAAGYFYYPWAYPTSSGHFAFIVLAIIESIGYIFCVKVMEEGSNKNSNGIVGLSVGGGAIFVLIVSLFVGW
jgi:hypothetical protein